MGRKALIPPPTPFIDPATGAESPRPLLLGGVEFVSDRAISSAVEHFVDIEGVTGSIPVSPTMNSPL